MRKRLIIALNLLILVLGVICSVLYSGRLQEERTQMTKNAFVSTVESMTQVSLEHLREQQEHVNNWANYINGKTFTEYEAIGFLREMNQNSDIIAQIIDTDDFTGLSTAEDIMHPGSYSVSYDGMSGAEKEALRQLAEDGDDNNSINITGAFVNPQTGVDVVGFAKRVTVINDDGKLSDDLLLRLTPLKKIQDQWIFPTGYDEAEISLVTEDGDYIIRSESMKSENFLEFIRAYNDLTYPESDALKAAIMETRTGILEYNNARGESAYYVYSSLGEDIGNWYVVGYIPENALKAAGTDWALIGLVCGIMGILFVIDGAYFVLINRRLQESAETAREASEAKTRFLSSMSHDIRTPMNAIVGMTEIAMRHIDSKERVKDCLEKITLASNHLLTLINDVLDISRVERGQLVLNPMVFSLANTILNLTNVVRPQIHAKGLDFQFHVIDLKHEYLYADELRLNQIFINLLSNAVKYTPEGGRITVTLRQETIENDAADIDLEFTVEDTGIGMSESFAKTIFEPFTRAKDSRIDTIAGSGLGLAITKQMVDAMKGSIDVKSELGKGSVFTVRLRLPVAESPADDLKLPPLRILIADDDPVCLESTADMLESLSVDADCAESGAKALQMAVDAKKSGSMYPMIILDWKMPGMDGLETAKALRKAVGDDVPLVILSAFDWSEIEDEARAAGVNGFISKPLFKSSIYQTINDMLHLDDKAEITEDEDTGEFDGMHLLVAEDNDMNWEIIHELLGFYGITSDRAENGEICVQTLKSCKPGTYFAVLMDIQMPVMNGKEATKEIRKLAIPYIRDIPIIAMTADAFAEDVRECLDIGMDGHVPKPVDMKVLLNELGKIKERNESGEGHEPDGL